MTLPKESLIQYFIEGCKREEDCGIGVEHELLVYHPHNWQRVGYQDGILPLFQALLSQGWTPGYENSFIKSLTKDGQVITTEPGGQFELSGKVWKNLHQVKHELDQYFAILRALSSNLSLAFVPLGFDPVSRSSEAQWMPSCGHGRYKLMRQYMPQKGTLGLEMMTNTCTVQANLDYTSEADMVNKMRLAMALQPLVIALFANSPFKEARHNGYWGYRSQVWQNTDSDRCGILPFVFEQDMGFERYVDYLLGVPMYFVQREQHFLDYLGQSFADFMQTPEASSSDWANHVTTVFPEVRLKTFLEVRGADVGSIEMIMALPAFFVGLLYDPESLQAGLERIARWSSKDVIKLYQAVPQQGLNAKIGGETMRDLAQVFLGLSAGGLQRRALGEENYLWRLWQIAKGGPSLAEQALRSYNGHWQKNLARWLEEQRL